jgi:uncharacterized membrane protein HdeD (DUF308 family)
MERTWKPTAAGILAIIAGALHVILGIIIAAIGGIAFFRLTAIFAGPFLILGIIAIVGGIYALRREIWGLALAGAICAIIPLILPWNILGILAVIFVSLGKREFK